MEDSKSVIEVLKRECCGKCAVFKALRILEEAVVAEANSERPDEPESVYEYPKKPEPVAAITSKVRPVVIKQTPVKTRYVSLEKTCKKCNTIKPLTEFPANSGCRDGYTNECKVCTRERVRKAQHKSSGTSKSVKTSGLSIDSIEQMTHSIRDPKMEAALNGGR